MNKKSIILIACVSIMLLAVILFIIYLIRGGSIDIKDISNKNNVEDSELPVLTLIASPEEETEDEVEISITATIGGQNEIVSVKTPDGKTSGYTEGGKVYKVDENGEYSFTVTASNGKKATESINIKNISKVSSNNPYIPEGFKHIEGTEVDTGFIIEDKYENQYIWVPVENGTPVRDEPSEKFIEDNYITSSINNSISKYYGFYIARYEASKKNVNGMTIARSIKKCIPWSNVNYDEAFEASNNTAIAYDYVGVKTALMNSYTWDTTINWLDNTVKNYSTSKNYGNYSNQILPTGETESDIVNGIADMAGNLKEWTTEKYIEENVNEDNNTENSEVTYRVIRGGSATMPKVVNSRIGERTDLKDGYWGFRIVLYKE